MSNIFFSYSRDDGDFVRKLAEDLRKAGASLWLDQLDIAGGERWDHAIEKALHACVTQIVVLSPNSISSQNVMDEVSYALEEGKQVIPVLCQECDVPFRLRRVQRIDFTASYDQGFRRLVATLALEGQSQPFEEEDRTPVEKTTGFTESAAPQPKPKTRSWRIPIVLVVVLAAGSVGYVLLQNSGTGISGLSNGRGGTSSNEIEVKKMFSKEETTALVLGKTVFWENDEHAYYDPDGTLYTLSEGEKEKGQWYVTNIGAVCRRVRGWTPELECESYYRRQNGTVMDISSKGWDGLTDISSKGKEEEADPHQEGDVLGLRH